jgi:rhamnose utilization protein RhaD (predicted bifunctional aldolase and dehydrogenase)
MQNLWNENEAKKYKDDLSLRVYSSNLLGRDDELVLHGGGNTSLKTTVNTQDILFVKGSGWDLVSIQKEGFAGVDLETLKNMAKLTTLNDSDMVTKQKKAMIDNSMPNPSVEAILHAIIPFKYVDHTHSDAVVTISNTTKGKEYIKTLYPNFLIVPYVMPGFILAKKIYEMSQDISWQTCEGIILHNHGIFTFDDDPKKSYDKMIDAVSLAQEFLEQNAPLNIKECFAKQSYDINELREKLAIEKNCDLVAKINISKEAVYYSSFDDLNKVAKQGLLTPEHIIRTKLYPMILDTLSIDKAIENYKNEYIKYFEKHKKDEVMLSPTPNYVVIKDYGIVSFGKDKKEANIIHDIISHTIKAVLQGDILGGYQSISVKDSFDMEYWELEQAKLKK